MKTNIKYFLIVILLCFQITVFSQENNCVVILSERVGTSIDRKERDYFHLFERFNNFKEAVVYQSPSGEYSIKVTTNKTGSDERDTTILFPEISIKNLAEKINHFEDIMKGNYRIGQDPPKIGIVESNSDKIKYQTLTSHSISSIKDTLDTVSIQKIILNDNSELLGTIVRDNNMSITFRTMSGLETEINRTMIKEMSVAKGEMEDGKFLRQDPNRTRLFFFPTGRTLEGGEVYFSTYEIFFPSLAFGLTDFITLSGGMTLFTGAPQQMFYIAPKIRVVHLNKLDVSGGAYYAHINEGGFGIAYGVASYGSNRISLSFGAGWGFIDDEVADKPALIIGGELQLSNSIKLITENWVLLGSDINFISFGIRFFGEHLAADFALVRVPMDDVKFPFIPWIGFAINL